MNPTNSPILFKIMSSISKTPNLSANCTNSISIIPNSEAKNNLSKRFNCFGNAIGNRNPNGKNTTMFPMILIINGPLLLLLYSII